MKNKIGLTLITIISLMQSCTKQEYVNIPKNVDGSAYITKSSTTTTKGITTLDGSFTVSATLPNAKVGDEMIVELLANQMPSGGSALQLLPIAGTAKKVLVQADFTASATFTRAEALLVNLGDNVTYTFAGKTESAQPTPQQGPIILSKATAVSGPLYDKKAVQIYRNAGAAYFDVKVSPIIAAYTANVTVLKKNGINLAWSSSSLAYGTKVPISGDDFAAGKDTMYYAFVAAVGSYSDTVKMTVFANPALFQLTKSGTMTLGATTGGVNVLNNGTVKATDTLAILAIDAVSLQIHAGSALQAATTISFVPSTSSVYSANNSDAIIALFDAGTASATVDPIAGVPINIFKIVDGANTYYGILKIASVVPGTSVSYEYKIGNTYAQLAILK